jgi:hypothetical protein
MRRERANNKEERYKMESHKPDYSKQKQEIIEESSVYRRGKNGY